MNRRTFLCACAGAGVAGGSALAAPHLLPGRTFLNTVLLAGPPEAKLRSARAGGFDQVEVWTTDVAEAETGARSLRMLCNRIGLGVTDCQGLLDFDGAPGDRRMAKRTEALALLDTAVAMETTTVLVPASTDPDCDPSRVGEDLAWLVGEARQRGLKIAYEGMAWSTVNNTLDDAFAAVRDLDPHHAGVVVDSYHLFVRGGRPEVLAGIPPERIALVQFCDVAGPVQPSDYKEVARHARLLPGEGTLPLTALVRTLGAIGYRGPVGLEVFNDRLKAASPEAVAAEAFRALQNLLSSAGPASSSGP